MISVSTADALTEPPEATARLALVYGADDLTHFRLSRILDSIGLRAERTRARLTRHGDDPPAVALVVASSATDWRTVGALSPVDTVVLTSEPSAQDEQRALELGAIGYLPLHLADGTLSKALRAIVAGQAGFSRTVLGRWLRGQDPRAAVDAPELTKRQEQILELIARGAADKEIARELRIATATVHKHVQALLRRLGVPNRAAAVRYARAPRATYRV